MNPTGKTTYALTGKTSSAHLGRLETSDTESFGLPSSLSIQDDDDSSGLLSPVPDRLSRCAIIGHGAMYVSRVIGSGMFSTGFSANVCRHMMDKPTAKASENLLMGLGVLSYLTGMIGSVSTVSGLARRDSIQQSIKDAVVPAIVSFSVYLALAHGVI